MKTKNITTVFGCDFVHIHTDGVVVIRPNRKTKQQSPAVAREDALQPI